MQRTRVRFRLTGTAGPLILLGLVALLVWLASHRDLHLGLAVVIAVAVLVDLAFARRAVSRIAFDLRPPTIAQAWEPSHWQLHTTGWNRPVVVVPLLVGTHDEQLLEDPRPAILTWPGTPRGPIPFVVFDTVARGPLGLVDAGRRLWTEFPEPVCFGPKLLGVDQRWPRPVPVGFGPVDGAPVGEELFRAIRPYRRGYDRRRVDWKSTARHGSLMVRELDGTGAVLMRIVVDLGPPGVAAERTAAVAAWVAAAALAQNWLVELVTLDASAHVPTLGDLGKTFGRPPVVLDPVIGPMPTLTGRVRDVREVQRRLATTAHGTPVEPPKRGRTGQVCRVSQAGVTWT